MSKTLISGLITCAIAVGTVVFGQSSFAAGACNNVASLLSTACDNGASSTYYADKAKCENISDIDTQSDCRKEASIRYYERKDLCDKQETQQIKVCAAVGDTTFEPPFSPRDFIRAGFSGTTYFPLAVGNKWTYGGAESVVKVVQNQRKNIDGVTCIVVRETTRKSGDISGPIVNDTKEWLAQNKTDGNIYNCGKEVKVYESFTGDRPKTPELINITGSFKVGRDDAKPGFAFLNKPRKGSVYRQEYLMGKVEGVAKIISTNYSYGQQTMLDKFVPEALANLLCSNNCIVVSEYSPLVPGVSVLKYYASGIGMFLKINPAEKKAVQLIDCSFDPRCKALPQQ